MSPPLAVLRDGTEVAAAYDDLDEGTGALRRWAPVRLAAVDPVRKATLLADPRCRRLEMVRSARLGSPLALARTELDAIEDLIGGGVRPAGSPT